MNPYTEIVVHPIDTLEGAPEGPGAEPVADAAWVPLSRFEVQVNQRSKITAPVYANGRQQVPVEIIIEARDSDGVVVSLSDAQMRTIRLINYNTSTAVVGCKHDKDERFIYQWAPLKDEDGEGNPDEDVPADTPRATAQAIMIYVHTTAVSAFKIAAEITSPLEGVFRTNTPNPGPGKFDSWVSIGGQEAPIYDDHALIMERVDEASNMVWDVDLYYIRFSEEDFNIVGAVHHDAAADQPHLSIIHNGNQNRFHIAFAVGAKRTIRFYNSGNTPGISFEVNRRPGEATAARCIVQGALYYNEKRQESCIWYFNQYGNYARCALGNTHNNDYNMISLGEAWHG